VEAEALCEEARSGSKFGSDLLYTELEAEAKNIPLLPHPCSKQNNH